MATKKSAAKSATTTIKTRAERAKTLSKKPAAKVPGLLTIEQLAVIQETARAAFEKARALRWAAVEADASEARVAALIDAQEEARKAWMQARFERWGAVEAERAIKRGKDAELPEGLTQTASPGTAAAMIARLKARLAQERLRAQPDTKLLAAISSQLKLAREAFEV